ncbi:glutamine synthetase beta-grasp domain-containing protein [Aeromicrobium chenweiae]|uniref:glutamine synthetase n=1 Tax=Aeromicrobium chenweiae TaxID=2079793 RepID=A0A2S0WL75_9ACTN|nr:glutamine synthetase family protein [Aeromicrobium chenweiae]AWB92099.1 glutamine synthetase [Aeromicrobium chenweiae]TGN32948.1 glutamine synthetase [Aeromicrobium chenweiae]
MVTYAFEPHPIVRLFEKPAAEFTCSDLVRAAEQLELRQVNLRYVGGDGRLKTVAFPVDSREHLTEVLTQGERVDGSSIFPGVGSDASDVYIVPRHRTAFVNPFGERPSLDVLCSFYDEEGKPLSYAREQVVRKASEALTEETGMVLEAFGELEYYLVDAPDPVFPVEEEHGYQESEPFSKGQRVREQVLGHLAAMGIKLKYAHGEVGNILEEDRQLVQHEIEFWPVPVEQAADVLVMAKWVVREVAYQHGLEVTFAPSVSSGGAGSGLHVHSRLVRDGASTITDDGGVNDTGRRLIAGYLSMAKALTAFGNTVPTSYLRFTEGGESPEGISWGETDRTGLVRVPLAWGGGVLPGMVAHANPGSSEPIPEQAIHPQTVELRLGDGSADVHLLLAGMAVAARRGLADPDSLKVAERLSTDKHDKFEQLPASCSESADVLQRERAGLEADGVFPPDLIDSVIDRLRSYDDAKLMKKAAKDDATREELVRRFWHVG